MNDHQTTCDPQRIELFLEQKLSDEEQSAFESHLSDCGNCRQRLESAAASEDIASEICGSLRGDCPDFRDDQCVAPAVPRGRENGTVHFTANGLRSGDSDSAGEEAFSSQTTVLKLLAPTDDERMLGRWGAYEVMGVVGTGGMGVVLKAFDAALNRYVAIKVLAPHLGSSGSARRRFSREAQASAAVVHDNVIEIYGVAEAAGLPYLVMPYVRGPSLQRRLDAEGPMALAEILRVGFQAAAGLAAAHAQGLVHRDVKPANILLADGVERVKLTDFGLARAADDASLTKTGFIAGTPQYMSPEQARGESVDQRSDLFSLGSVLYAMCTGRPPFRAETSYGVLRRITDEEPRPIRETSAEIPEWLCGIVAKLMAKRLDDRFQSAAEVAKLLEQCLAHVQQPTAVPLPTYSPLPSGGGQMVRAMNSPLPPGEGQGVRAVESSLRLRDRDTNPKRERGLLRAFLAYASGWYKRPGLIFGTLAMLALIGISLFAVIAATSNPPDISGNWQGEDWGRVTLTQTAPGEYTGTYTDTVAKEKGPGKIDLKWSRIERRYNGTWREGGDDRFGDLSIHMVGDEIRGGLTTSAKSKINPATPRLAELVWIRGVGATKPTKTTPMPSAVIDIAERRGGPWIGRLPEGQIELVAVGNDQGEDKYVAPWWLPDGTPTTVRTPDGKPLAAMGAWTYHTLVDRSTVFLFSQRGLPKDASEPVWRFDPPEAFLHRTGEALRERDFGIVAAALPKTAKSVNIAVGIAADKWETIAAAPGSTSITALRRGDVDWSVSFDAPTAGRDYDGETIEITVSHQPVSMETRLLAIGRDGAEHFSRKLESLGSREKTVFKATFSKLKLGQISEYRFQAHPYQWVEFRNVLLDPVQRIGAGAETGTPPEPVTKEEKTSRVPVSSSKTPESQPPNVSAMAELKSLLGPWDVVRVEKGKYGDESWAAIWAAICQISKSQRLDELDPAVSSHLTFRESGNEPTLTIQRLGPMPIRNWSGKDLQYRIDPAAAPKAIDLLQTDLSQTPRLVAQGIYEIQGDQLTICLARPLSAIKGDQRPGSFSPQFDSGEILFVLQRHLFSKDEKAMQGVWDVSTLIQDGQAKPREKLEHWRWEIDRGKDWRPEDGDVPTKPILERETWGFEDGFVMTYERLPNRQDSILPGAVVLNTTAQPKEITIFARRFLTSSDDHKQLKESAEQLRGIYKFDAGRLTIAYRTAGPRPRKFESPPGSGVTLIVLEGKKPLAPEHERKAPDHFYDAGQQSWWPLSPPWDIESVTKERKASRVPASSSPTPTRPPPGVEPPGPGAEKLPGTDSASGTADKPATLAGGPHGRRSQAAVAQGIRRSAPRRDDTGSPSLGRDPCRGAGPRGDRQPGSLPRGYALAGSRRRPLAERKQ